MSNALALIRTLIIYSLCLPLAVFLGYLLAMPMDTSSFTVLVVAIGLPLLPFLLKHHHLLLFACWNTSMVMFFLPGKPSVAMVMIAVSLMLSVLQHILNRNIRFLGVPSITRPLIFLVVVVVVTAQLTGGLGMRFAGSDAYGGKRYVVLLTAILGYFAMTCYRIPAGKANLYVAFYLLGAITSVIGSLAPFAPRWLYFIFSFFPVETLSFLQASPGEDMSFRLGGVSFAASATACYMLARHGIQGLFDFREQWKVLPVTFKGGLGFTNPWRFLIFLIMVWFSMIGGYRASVVMLLFVCAIQFYYEGLFRTRFLPGMVLALMLTGAVMVPFASKLPITIQRSLSFLPLDIDPIARYGADSTVEWRVDMWKRVLPMVPQYLLLGKGYSINAAELDLTTGNEERTGGNAAETAILVGDYHNGPLSVIIPFGIFGVFAFLWFLWASFRLLLKNFRYGDPELHMVNTFLLTYFVARVIFFFTIFGAFHGELILFTGLVGLSVSLNGGMREPAPEVVEKPAFDQFKLARAVRS